MISLREYKIHHAVETMKTIIYYCIHKTNALDEIRMYSDRI